MVGLYVILVIACVVVGFILIASTLPGCVPSKPQQPLPLSIYCAGVCNVPYEILLPLVPDEDDDIVKVRTLSIRDISENADVYFVQLDYPGYDALQNMESMALPGDTRMSITITGSGQYRQYISGLTAPAGNVLLVSLTSYNSEGTASEARVHSFSVHLRTRLDLSAKPPTEPDRS